jgi:serine/threonine protein kinase
MLAEGQEVERYRLEAPLGEGGMAVVWRARHLLLGSVHALKVLRPELVHESEVRERFLSEGRIQAQLRHPNIAAVSDLVSESGIAGLVMELLEGETLEDRLRRAGPLDAASLLQIFVPVLDALGEAHDRGVVHRDLKPSNLFLAARTRGRVRPVVLDFGIAKVRDEARFEALRRGATLHGARMGTPAYMSPEQVRDPRAVDGRSDLFSLGAILYEAITGAQAFAGETDHAITERILTGHLEDPRRRVAPELAPVADVVRRALAVDPALRFADALELSAALESAVRGVRQPPPRVEAPLRVEALPRVEAPRVSPRAEPPPVVVPVAAPAARDALVTVPGGRRFVLDADRMIVEGVREDVRAHEGAAPRHTHAVLERRGGAWWVAGHGRGMGVSVDGERVIGERALGEGQELEVGVNRFRLVRG